MRVNAGDVDATVLGTVFDVKIMSQAVAVAISHGRVAVDKCSGSQQIVASFEGCVANFSSTMAVISLGF